MGKLNLFDNQEENLAKMWLCDDVRRVAHVLWNTFWLVGNPSSLSKIVFLAGRLLGDSTWNSGWEDLGILSAQSRLRFFPFSHNKFTDLRLSAHPLPFASLCTTPEDQARRDPRDCDTIEDVIQIALIDFDYRDISSSPAEDSAVMHLSINRARS